MSPEPLATPGCPGCSQREATIAGLQQQVADLQRQLDELRRQLEQAQQAGKRQAHPFRRAQPKPNPKKPGRPKGHPRAARPVPTKVDTILDVPCDTCPDCKVGLVAPVVHHQYQTDIPPVVPVVTRFDIHGGTCPHCKRYHQGRHPLMTSAATGAAANQLGPVALSLAAELKHRLGVPYRKVADILGTYFGLPVCHAALVRAERRLAKKGAPTFRLLQEALRAAGVAHADETGWRVGRLGAWLWVFCTERVTVYAIAGSRGHEVPEAILGEDFDGILVVDGWSAYDVLACRKGRCHAHILRRCRDLLEQGPPSRDERLLVRLMEVLRAGLELSKQYEGLPEAEYWARARRWEDDFDGWLLGLPQAAGTEVVKLRNHLLNHHDEFLAHVFVPGTPGTNNLAEQQIRPAVISRKVGGCNKTVVGALVHMVLASLMATLRQQGKRFVELALPLWRSAGPVALDVGALPEVVEKELPEGWPELDPATHWPVPLAASG
jgi:transposase